MMLFCIPAWDGPHHDMICDEQYLGNAACQTLEHVVVSVDLHIGARVLGSATKIRLLQIPSKLCCAAQHAGQCWIC